VEGVHEAGAQDRDRRAQAHARDSVANLSEEVAAKDKRIVELESHVADLEAARPVAGDIEAAVDVINAQAEKMSPADYKKALLRITWVNDLWAIITGTDSTGEGTDSTLEDRLKELKAMTLGGFSLSPRRKTVTVARSPESDIGELHKAAASISLSPRRKQLRHTGSLQGTKTHAVTHT
jgi:hypothetical protein